MLTSDETWCLHNDIEIIFIRLKPIKCNELISFLKSHNDLG